MTRLGGRYSPHVRSRTYWVAGAILAFAVAAVLLAAREPGTLEQVWVRVGTVTMERIARPGDPIPLEVDRAVYGVALSPGGGEERPGAWSVGPLVHDLAGGARQPLWIESARSPVLERARELAGRDRAPPRRLIPDGMSVLRDGVRWFSYRPLVATVLHRVTGGVRPAWRLLSGGACWFGGSWTRDGDRLEVIEPQVASGGGGRVWRYDVAADGLTLTGTDPEGRAIAGRLSRVEAGALVPVRPGVRRR